MSALTTRKATTMNSHAFPSWPRRRAPLLAAAAQGRGPGLTGTGTAARST